MADDYVDHDLSTEVELRDYKDRNAKLEVEKATYIDRRVNVQVSNALPGGTGLIKMTSLRRYGMDPTTRMTFTRYRPRRTSRQTRYIQKMIIRGQAVEIQPGE